MLNMNIIIKRNHSKVLLWKTRNTVEEIEVLQFFYDYLFVCFLLQKNSIFLRFGYLMILIVFHSMGVLHIVAICFRILK